jgi:hypothetical protein
MALPGGVTPVVVTGKVANNKNVPATGGTVTFRMPYALSDGTDHVVLAPGVWSFNIGSDGTINTASDPMPAATSPGVSPSGWSYEVTVRAVLADSSVWFRKFFVQITANASFEQLVAAAAPTPAPAVAYVPLSAVGVSVAPLVAGKVPSQYLPPGGGGSGVESVTASNGTIAVDNTDPLNPKIGTGTGIPQASISGLTSALGTLTDDVTAASNAAAGAATQAGAALSAANAAQATADAAYVKPAGGIPAADLSGVVNTDLGLAATAYQKPGAGIPATDLAAAVQTALTEAGTAYQLPVGGIPEADLSTAVQNLLTLAGTAVQSIPPYADPAAVKLHPNGHSINVPVSNRTSTINGEAWAARVVVEAHNPINGVFTLRARNADQGAVPAAAVGAGGLNGFAVFAEVSGGTAAGNKLADTGAPNTDDNIWLTEGVVDRALSGIPTPSVRTAYWVLVSVRGYSGAPYFSFFDFGGGGNSFNAQLYGKYKGGGFATWPATLTPATDLGSGAGFVLPIGLRS